MTEARRQKTEEKTREAEEERREKVAVCGDEGHARKRKRK